MQHHLAYIIQQQEAERQRALGALSGGDSNLLPIAPSHPHTQGFPWEDLIKGFLLGAAIVGGAALVGAALSTGAAALGQALASKKNAPRLPKGDTYNYDLLQEGEVVYQGITKRPDERPEEHLLDGKIFDEVVYDEPKPRPIAKALEAARLAEFRAENDGYNPLYNRTRNG